jgi:hypothetical protein
MALDDPFVIQVSLLLLLISNIKSVISTITLLNNEQPYLLFNPFNEEEGEGKGNLQYVIFKILIALSKCK